MKRRIIVFSTSWNDEHVGGVLSGIKQKADETNTDVYIFNNYGGFEGDEKFNKCEYNIFNLPQIELFDGVLILSNNAHSLNRLNHIIEKIIKNKIPCISIEQDIEELHFVGTDNYKAMYELVEHLIEKHGCKTLNYIGGPTEHPENKERKRAFIDALTNHGIIPEEKRMKDYYFTYDSGIKAYHYFKESGIEIPDAVVCANDDTALGYADMLTEHGYKVPDDLIITGFDNSSLGREYFPGITSVGRSTIELGQNSLEELLGLIDGKEYPHATYTKHKLCVNGSCGCMSNLDDYAEILRERSHKNRSIMHSRWKVNYFQKNLMICHNMEELKSALYRELFTLKVEEFCILTNENEFAEEDSPSYNLKPNENGYTERMQILFEKTSGDYSPSTYVDTKQIIPYGFGSKSEDPDHNNHVFAIMPMHLNGNTMGYCIFEYDYTVVNNGDMFYYVSVLNSALENIKQNNRIRELNHKLNNMYVRDAMTGIYNRFALKSIGEPLLKENFINDKKTLFLFADMDSLKKLNDTYGHDAGDMAIKKLSEIINDSRLNDTCFCIRYGGDEFLMMGTCESYKEAELIKEKIENKISDYNKTNQLPATLSASIGYIIAEPNTLEYDIDYYISRADEIMYSIKKSRKNVVHKNK